MRHNCKTRTWRVVQKYFGEDVPHTLFGFGACWQSFGMAVVKRNVDRLWNKVIVFFCDDATGMEGQLIQTIDSDMNRVSFNSNLIVENG